MCDHVKRRRLVSRQGKKTTLVAKQDEEYQELLEAIDCITRGMESFWP